jgi:Transposase IS66 family
VRRICGLQASGRAGNAVILAFCWARWHRRFYEIAKAGAAPIAEEALRRIVGLYKIEAQIRGKSAAERRGAPGRKQPLIADLKAWLEAQLARASAKSAIAVAIRYGLKHWDGFERFLEDGRIEIDTNVVERSMRPLATARSLCPLLSRRADSLTRWGHTVIARRGRLCRCSFAARIMRHRRATRHQGCAA